MAASSRALPGSCSAKLVVPDISVTGPVKRVRLAVSIDHTAARWFPCAHPGNAGLYTWPLPESASDTITAPPLEGRSDFYWRRSTEPSSQSTGNSSNAAEFLVFRQVVP